MEIEELDNDVAKEVFMVLSVMDNKLLNTIPKEILEEIIEKAADSKKTILLDPKKELKDQKITEEAKDFISLLYCFYIANKKEQENLLDKWMENEK